MKRNHGLDCLLTCAAFALSAALAPSLAWAAQTVADHAVVKPKPPPYSLPFQLRPTGVGKVIRSDTAFAFYEAATGTGDAGNSVATTLLGSYPVTPELAPFVRFSFVQNSPPAGSSGQAFGNPVVGATYALKLSPEWRLAPFLGFTVPIGSGGGNTPNPATRAALAAAVPARSAMDNALFATNYFVVIPGIGLSWTAGGFTLQAEATVLQLLRVRGDNVPADADSARTNFTSGLHAGYFLLPKLSVGVELRHQRWLSTPVMVRGGATGTPPPNPAARDTSTFALGARLHLQVSETNWVRPAIAYARAIDLPVRRQKYDIVQFDLPVSF